MKSIKNRRALHEYFIIQKYEAGISLKGTEIKSIRAGMINFKDSYAKVDDGQCWLLNLHISPWEKAAFFNHEAERPRRLLMHKSEIKRLKAKVEEQGMTLVGAQKRIKENKEGTVNTFDIVKTLTGIREMLLEVKDTL